ncbi:MinD/ParA/CobQ/CobA-like protein [Novipirellula aureliae]|uniref:MinD/ParA/CobQ/CobA-like protein n=1 Tax=Novipirellula aureliae TaxID=2527966 RepID=A0A5C6DIV8_9BACT|nr:AAA family ATPase [Novipirellula aureliae]TWU36512.1 MinD/ParA/CobQ/CobA-like protein [Novipirellula aureliae]
MPILLMINLKGGVGKTASTVAIAETLADQGQRTLVIDADHQSMAGELLVGEQRILKAEKSKATLHDMFLKMADLGFEPSQLNEFAIPNASNVQSAAENLSVVPCSFRIDDFFGCVSKSRRICRSYASERDLQTHLGRQMRKVQRWVREEYDFVLVDCPPSIAMQVKMFLRIADGYIIPSIPDQLSVRGSANLVNRLNKLNFTRIEGLGTLWTLYREQVALHREVVSDPFSGIPDPFQTIIPNATKLASAVDPRGYLNPVATCEVKYGKPFAERYRHLVDEIYCRCELYGIETIGSLLIG